MIDSELTVLLACWDSFPLRVVHPVVGRGETHLHTHLPLDFSYCLPALIDTISLCLPRGYKGIYTPTIFMHCPQRDIFLTDIIGYDRLTLYLKIYTVQNEIIGTQLFSDGAICELNNYRAHAR